MNVEEIMKLKESDVLSITAGQLAELIEGIRAEHVNEDVERWETALEKQYNDYIKSLSSDEEGKKMEYPNQVASIVRTNKTLGVDAFLSVPDTKNGQSPLELHAGYSRFVLTLIDSSSGKAKFIHANIHPDQIELIKKKTELATEKIFAKKNGWEKEETSLSPAYTVMMTSKEIAKKTPAQLLNESAANKAKLEAAKAWLTSNLARYPKNKEQIDAIDDAIKLFDEGKLQNIQTASKVFDIYREDIKIPNSKKLYANHGNKTLVYSISIVCQPDQNYPFAINIMNTYAPAIKGKMGIQADLQKQQDKEEFSILLSEDEWNKVINKMSKNVTLFEQENYKDMLAIVKDHSYYK